MKVADGRRSVLILGTRGIPAAHGGFETFAERLALHLAAQGWHVGVYCQRDVARVERRVTSETWRGVELLQVEVASKGPAGTLEFDAVCVADAAKRGGVALVLGYNGALFLPWLRLKGRRILTNMDGIEWRRPKWPLPVKAWFWVNEWIAAWSSDRLVADHPRIADHLATRRPRRAIATIPYGGDPITSPSPEPLRGLGLQPDRYLVSIARIEPDNSIATLVEAFSRKPRGAKLAVLGKLDEANAYHRRVREAAGPEVVFPGAIYEAATVQALRGHARAYLHGHTVGGTNPSLVEALWAGNAVIAHDNPFNRWTAGEDQLFFEGADACERAIERVLGSDETVARAREAALARAREQFSWDVILAAYEAELLALS
jgi:glycosyltransferase involved in cell wall biosynthesis